MVLMFIDPVLPWNALITPVVLPQGGQGESFVFETDFDIEAGGTYLMSLDYLDGQGSDIIVTGIIIEFAGVLKPSGKCLSHADDPAYGGVSDWGGAATGTHKLGDIDDGGNVQEAVTAVITAGTSFDVQGGVTETAAASTDGTIGVENPLSDPDLATVNYIYGAGEADVLDASTSTGPNVLDGGAGADTLIGGSGNDILVWDAADLSVDGNGGFDLLRVDGDDDLGPTDLSKLADIEIIDLSGWNELAVTNGDAVIGFGTNDLTMSGVEAAGVTSLTYNDVLAADGDSLNSDTGFEADLAAGTYGSYEVLFVNGDGNDSVTLNDGKWSQVGTDPINSYNVYINTDSNVMVLVDEDILSVTLA